MKMNKFVITLIFIAFSLLSCSNNDFDESECIEFNLKYIKLYELAERDAEQTRYLRIQEEKDRLANGCSK